MARASQFVFPVLINLIVDLRSTRSASALSRKRAKSWRCHSALGTHLQSRTVQPKERQGPSTLPVLCCRSAGTQPTEPAPTTHGGATT